MLSVWQKVIQKIIESAKQQDDARRKDATSLPILRAELQIPHTIVDRYDTSQHKNNTREWWRLLIESATLVFAVLGFWILYQTLCATRAAVVAAQTEAGAAVAATDVARDQLRLSERPWVGAYEIILGKFTPGEQVRVEVVLRNSGKTPALSMKNKIRGVAVYGIPEEPPNIPPIALYASEMVLMPNQTSRIHPVGVVPLTHADFNNVMVKKDWVFVVWGKIIYTDKFQVEGETTLCAYYIPEIQRFGACTKGNSAK